MTALRTEFASSVDWSIERKNDDLPFWIGPEIFPPKERIWLAARFDENGFRELRLSSLNLAFAEPRHLSVPGRVKISMRPKPSRSNSAENGLLLIRTSRIDSFGGSSPPVKPSM